MMKTPLGRYGVLILSLALSCQAEPTTPIKMILFQANWCAPCKTLEKELTAANIQADWKFDDEGCIYHVSVMRVDYTDYEKTKADPNRKFKKTDAMPEQALFLGENLIANDNYSDKASLASFVKNSLHSFKEKNPRGICEPRPGFFARIKRALRISPF